MQHNLSDVADRVALDKRRAAAETRACWRRNLSLETPVVPCRAPGKSEPKRKERAEDLEGLVDNNEDLEEFGEDSKSRQARSAPAPASAQAGLKHSL